MRKIGVVNVFCSVSSKEIEKVKAWLIPSLARQKNVDKIFLYLLNYRGKGRVYKGERNFRTSLFIKELSNAKPLGFGETFNHMFAAIRPKDYFLVVNPDIYLHENCLSEMVQKMISSKDIGIIEAKQLPFEHPKEYDQRSLETPWASGACMLVNANFFDMVGGFDENFWMYCEDVDLSWRAWLRGYKVLYNPLAIAYHFTGAYFIYSDYRYYLEHFWSARNFIYLLYKYWRKKGEKKAIKIFLKTESPESFKKEVLEEYRDFKKKAEIPIFKEKRKLNKLKGKIKVLGFNKYHLMETK